MHPLAPRFLLRLAALLLAAISGARAADRAATQPLDAPVAGTTPAMKSSLLGAATRHLNLLLGADGTGSALKGKTAGGQEAFAFYLLFEETGNQAYRRVALSFADRVLQDMRATKFGVLPIKEKDKPGGTVIIGGGPPALGFYASRLAYILQREGGRDEDLNYIAGVLDRYPWSEDGWWASTIDVHTGESKEPMTKPSIINKTASMAMAAGIVSQYVARTAPELAARLKHKADKCIYERIIPAQQADGFWHYSLSGNDPKEKDVFGYFMLTTNVLMDLQQFNGAYRNGKLDAAVQRATDFALRCIAPMTDPNRSLGCRDRATPGTPWHYTLSEDTKRGFALSRILIAGGKREEGIKITNASLSHFPYGNGGQDGAHAAEPVALILAGWR